MASHDSEFGSNPYLTEPHGQAGALVTAPPNQAVPSPFGRPAQAAPGVLTEGFNQTWLANCLRRRWLSSLLLGSLVGACAALLMLWLFPESSSTKAYVRVKPRSESTIFDQERLSPAEIEKQTMTQLSTIKSTSVLTAALLRSDIAPLQAVRDQGNTNDAIQWLLEDLQVSFPNDGEMMLVQYDGEEDPREMERVLDAVVDEYLKEAVVEEKKKVIAARSKLEMVQKSTRERIQRKLQDYEDLCLTEDSTHSAAAEAEVQRLTREQTDPAARNLATERAVVGRERIPRSGSATCG